MTASRVGSTLDRLVERLLDERDSQGHWTGELASSALSTATAVIALCMAGGHDPLVSAGLNWLERTQNPDGGWGDTTLSLSNISTTALCWSAFTITGRACDTGRKAEAWMRQSAGSLEPHRLAEAIASRYGNDRTFSAPILTVLAVAGHVPWDIVPQLPFELAALPRSWYGRLGLPVVSYALPALIAIGHARHRRFPSRNWPVASIREAASAGTLELLGRIQPASGGYLEAIPLTSFVAISLRASGYDASAVLQRAIRFLGASVRPDGSWPIDTNLSTWVTTLSVNALGDRLPADQRTAIREWLLGQQYTSVHPYTGAAPGGWAWTDLSGGVPDADDTAGAVIALAQLGERDSRVLRAATSGLEWLLELQNRDGGIPTFCRGWGKLPFDRSSPDLTAHALIAWSRWRPSVAPSLQSRIDRGISRAIAFLKRAQRSDGSWTPLWFGNQFAAGDHNPVYGTSRVLVALNEMQAAPAVAQSAADWLLSAQNEDGGWGGDRGLISTVEETSLAISALAGSENAKERGAVTRGTTWLVEATCNGERTPPSPIGFYFAKLWYFERLYPLIFATEAMTRATRKMPP